MFSIYERSRDPNYRRGGVKREIFHQIISLENLLIAWREFSRGKRSKPDVQRFEWSLEDNLYNLHQSLIDGTYTTDPYQLFIVADPKPRRIHKASVRDRVLFQAVYRVLYQIFDPVFIHDSYACRKKKGLHRAVRQLEKFLRRTSHNYRQPTYALKCDIRKFFDSVDHNILLELIKKRISCPQTIELLEKIIWSFETSPGKGLPLGNVTSQIFANIYLNQLDQFAKHSLKAHYYLRYCDDFVVISFSVEDLAGLIQKFRNFLDSHLQLELHDNKITIRKFRQGVDYLGYVTLPYYRVLRTKTKKRILRLVEKSLITESSLNSYLGILSHCRAFKTKLSLCYNGD